MDSTAKSIIIGSILGDGYISKPTKFKKTCYMEFKYSDKYFEYLKWLHSSFKSCDPGIFSSHQNGQHKFVLSYSKELGKLRELFYREGRKVVPSNIDELLTNPLSLAIWYMDDGTLDNRKKYHLNAMLATYSFTFQECKLLMDTLQSNFGVKSSVTRCQMRGKVYPRLYIWAKDTIKFLDLVRPYILPCFEYKVTPVSLASSSGHT